MSVRQITVDLVAAPATVTHAQRAAHDVLHEWGAGDAAGAVVSGVGELVSNAVGHAPGPLRLRMHSYARHVLVEVFDTSDDVSRLPQDTETADAAERDAGHGLDRVRAMADQWGWSRVRRWDWVGKRVWFTYRLRPAAGTNGSLPPRPSVLLPCHGPGRAHPATAASGAPVAPGTRMAVILPHIDRWFFGRILGGVTAELHRRDCQLVLYNLRGSPEFRRGLVDDDVLRGRADAVLAVCLDPDSDEIAHLRSLEVPVGLIGAEFPGFSSVTVDDFDGARKAVHYLANLGHERIGLIGGFHGEPLHSTAPMDRRAGYRQALAAHGLLADPQLETQADFSVAGGERGMAALLNLPRPPTAVFAACDEMAFGALRVLRDSGIPAPGGMSVVGFDDHDLSPLLDLTTVAQPVGDLARTAVRALLSALQDPDHPPGRVTLPTRLAIRSSAGPPPRWPGG